jgi:hypothetical protein
MRTSVDLNDRLLTLAKQAAAKRGITLRDVFEQALRAYLEPNRKQEGYRLELGVTRGQALPGVPVDDWSSLRRYVDELDCADDHNRYGK